MAINRDRMGKERHQQHRSPVFKLLRRRRNQPATPSSSIRLADHQNKNRDSFIAQPKTLNKRSKPIYHEKKLIICSSAYGNNLLLIDSSDAYLFCNHTSTTKPWKSVDLFYDV